MDDIVSDSTHGRKYAIHGLYLPTDNVLCPDTESLLEGQTVGKNLMKIKVIKIDGYQAGFGDYLIRWILRIIEVTPPLCFICTYNYDSKQQNTTTGDMAAGTAVITLKITSI